MRIVGRDKSTREIVSIPFDKCALALSYNTLWQHEDRICEEARIIATIIGQYDFEFEPEDEPAEWYEDEDWNDGFDENGDLTPVKIADHYNVTPQKICIYKSECQYEYVHLPKPRKNMSASAEEKLKAKKAYAKEQQSIRDAFRTKAEAEFKAIHDDYESGKLVHYCLEADR